jgi:hypothetical protein
MRVKFLTVDNVKMTVFGMLYFVVWYKFTDISEVITALMMEAVSTCETSVSFYQKTRRSTPEDGEVRTCEHLSLLNAGRVSVRFATIKMKGLYTGRRISENLTYDTIRGEGKVQRARGQDALYSTASCPPFISAGWLRTHIL